MSLLQRLSAVDDARYDSSYSTTIKRRACTPETREKVQQELQAWVQNPNAPKVFWMSGMAGTGKTTVGYSLCKWLEDNEQLGASFFCSRTSSSCRDLSRIVPTIAYQLALYSPAFRSALCKVLEDDQDIGSRNVVRQFEKLIREPLAAVKDAMPEGVVVVIDALDECDENYGVRLILETLLKFAATLPLKFFVASRPEHTIQDKMQSLGGSSTSVMHLHDIELSIVEDDIKKYLEEALSGMTLSPSASQIEHLAKHAGKLFIYAATAVRYIYPDELAVDSSVRLQAMLAMNPGSSRKIEPGKKYVELDRLYSTVLAAAFDERLEQDELSDMRLVLWTIVCAREPMTARTLASLLDLSEARIRATVRPLQSVLHVSAGSELISTLHASFPDYMLDQSRSGELHCDEIQHSEFLARRCFAVMKDRLRFNIGKLESSYVLDKDVPDFEQRVKEAISPTLLYASRYWGEHLNLATVSAALGGLLVEFLSDRLLFWMEVLNLRGLIAAGAPMLHQIQNWLSVSRVNDSMCRDSKTESDLGKQCIGECSETTRRCPKLSDRVCGECMLTKHTAYLYLCTAILPKVKLGVSKLLETYTPSHGHNGHSDQPKGACCACHLESRLISPVCCVLPKRCPNCHCFWQSGLGEGYTYRRDRGGSI
jgi:hypothetical protein